MGFSVVLMLGSAGVAAPIDAWCWPISNQLSFPLQGDELGRRVAVFVEERNQCGPDGIPPRVGELPADLEGLALLQWVVADTARATGQPPYGVWSRSDAWFVAPPDGAAVLDTWVRVDATAAPTLQRALASLSPQIRTTMGVYSPMDPPPVAFDSPNAVSMEGPLLEVLRALHAPHERGPVGYFVLPGRSIFAVADASGALPGERRIWSVELPPGVSLWRDPVTGEEKSVLDPRGVPRGWVPADDALVAGPNGERLWVRDVGPADLPAPGPGETPPPYPFPLRPPQR